MPSGKQSVHNKFSGFAGLQVNLHL